MRFEKYVLIFAFLLLAGKVMAAEGETNAVVGSPEDATPAMQYGYCVSEAAKVRNTCYSDMRATSETCKATTEGQADKRNMAKNCRTAYKDSKKTCKGDFKAKKMDCAQSYRPNFFTKLRYSMA